MLDVEGADLRRVGAFGRALGVEVGLVVRAGALPVGRVGVDRKPPAGSRWPSGSATARRRSRGTAALSAPGRGPRASPLVGGERHVEHRVEGLLFAIGRRRVAGLFDGRMFGVLVGLDVEGRNERFPGADARVVDRGAAPGCPPRGGSGRCWRRNAVFLSRGSPRVSRESPGGSVRGRVAAAAGKPHTVIDARRAAPTGRCP